jgi:ABC-2 type transport system permease protein
MTPTLRVLGALLGARLATARHVARDRDWPRLSVIAAFALLGAAAMGGEYVFLRRAFDALAEQGVAGPPLTFYSLETFFALVLVVGVLSAVVTASAVFFRLGENRLLVATPVSPAALFSLRSLETAALTSWAFALVAAPALVALGASAGRAPGFYLAGTALLVAFLVTGVGLGIVLTMVLGATLGHFRSRLGIVGLTVVLLVGGGLAVGRAVVPTRADFAVMFEPGMLNGTTIAIHFIEEKFAGWPSHPFAAALFGLAGGRGSQPGRALFWTAAWPILTLTALATIGAPLYGRLAGPAVEGLLLARPDGLPAGPARGHRPAGFPRVLRGPVGALMEKEGVTLLRSPEELTRSAFLGFLLLLYTVFFLRVPVPERGGAEEVVARLGAFSLLAAGYFLTTLALRFVYPALSAEGRAVWILLASPVRLGAVLRAKAAFYWSAGLVGLGGITFVGGWRLGFPARGLAGFAGLLALMSVTIVGVALALGVARPDFRGRPPDSLATSGGGLLTVAIALAYVGLTGVLGYRLLLAALTGAPGVRVVAPLGVAVLVSLGVGTGPVLVARRRLRTLEAH